MKAILRGKFIVKQAYLKKIETFQINNLTLHLQEIEEKQQSPTKYRKERVKTRTELNDIENKEVKDLYDLKKNQSIH